MPELRKDIITGEWVIVAVERAKRPENFRDQLKVKAGHGNICPFCSGNEYMTPGEVFSIDFVKNREANTPGWQVRVVPNKFPALLPNVELAQTKVGIYDIMSGFGVHEVIIHAPTHICNISELNDEELGLVVSAYIQRMNELKKDERIKSIIVMLNQGREAGASIEHSHSQVFGLPFIPPVIGEELSGTMLHFNNNDTCAMCDIIKFEKEEGKRVVFEDECFIILQPFASKNPFETWIVPKRHNPDFETITKEELRSFSHCLKLVVDFFYTELNNPSFNYYIHSAPALIDASKYFHWHLEFLPKLTIRAGFEIGTGVDINIASPEQTSDFMKKSLES